MMKRLIAYLMVLVTMFSMSVVHGFAAEIPGESEIMPCYDYTESVFVSLDIADDGTATAISQIAGYSGTTTRVYINMYLERKEDGKWVTVESWSDSTASYSLTLEESTDVDSGYTYRVRTSFHAYAGTSHEYITEYSEEVWFG